MAVGVLLAIFAGAIRSESMHWLAAAQLRESVLSEASTIATREGCSVVTLADAPDTVRGVYVFRVGLQEAMRARVMLSPHGTPCALRWNGQHLVR